MSKGTPEENCIAWQKLKNAQEKPEPTPPENPIPNPEVIQQKSDQIAALYDKHQLQKWAPEMYAFLVRVVDENDEYPMHDAAQWYSDAVKLLQRIEGEE